MNRNDDLPEQIFLVNYIAIKPPSNPDEIGKRIRGEAQVFLWARSAEEARNKFMKAIELPQFPEVIAAMTFSPVQPPVLKNLLITDHELEHGIGSEDDEEDSVSSNLVTLT